MVRLETGRRRSPWHHRCVDAQQQPQLIVAVFEMVMRAGMAVGCSREELLAAARLEERELVDRDAYLPLSAMIAISEYLFARAPNTNLGLRALEYAGPAMLGTLGYVIGHSPTLREALQAFIRYQNLLTPAVRWELIELSDGVAVRVEPPPPLARLRFPLETQTGLWVRIGRKLTGERWVPRALRLRHQPFGPPEEFTAFFGREVEFGAAVNELELSSEVLALPVVGARPELQPSLMALVQAQLPSAPAEPATTADQLRALLLEELPRGLTTKEEAARKLGVSARTLSRRLGAEGLSFRELLTQVREQLACSWLREPQLSIHEVAFLLGYSEPSTFHRSFRRWTGRTPAQWRQGAAT